MVIQEHFKFTRAEAVAWIKSSACDVRFYAHVGVKQVITDCDDGAYEDRTTVDLTHDGAIKLVNDYLTEHAESLGRRIPCCVYRDGDYVGYWIG